MINRVSNYGAPNGLQRSYASPAFGAKYLKSESLRLIAEYAQEKGKIGKLQQARKNIDVADLRTRLRVDIGIKDEKNIPYITFTRYNPKNSVVVPEFMDDMRLEKVTIYEGKPGVNPLKFALEKLIKLGNSAPKNNMYKNVVKKG